MPKNLPGTKPHKKSLRLQQLFFRAVIIFSLVFTISLLISMYTPLGYYLAKPLKLENVDNSQTVDGLIVLDGGSYPNGQLSLFTLERLVNAINLYHKGQAKKL